MPCLYFYFFKYQEDLAVPPLFLKLACIQQHSPLTQPGKIVLNFIIAEGYLPWEDFFEKPTKLGDIPLAVSKIVDVVE